MLWGTGVCNSNCCNGSTEIPIWATCEIGCTPNGVLIQLGSEKKRVKLVNDAIKDVHNTQQIKVRRTL